ncbi:hypothetical protein VE03_06120 [Pseudogymnoascus sp. 23342-1-I1]|nr:hypothetical protein VE03_06120 [Pseudogymnoascus sp. 23342-1-I1]
MSEPIQGALAEQQKITFTSATKGVALEFDLSEGGALTLVQPDGRREGIVNIVNAVETLREEKLNLSTTMNDLCSENARLVTEVTNLKQDNADMEAHLVKSGEAILRANICELVANDRYLSLVGAMASILRSFAADDMEKHGNPKIPRDVKEIARQAWEACVVPTARDRRFDQNGVVKQKVDDDQDVEIDE